jgi:hypothetical protein
VTIVAGITASGINGGGLSDISHSRSDDSQQTKRTTAAAAASTSGAQLILGPPPPSSSFGAASDKYLFEECVRHLKKNYHHPPILRDV